ncbi:uncharacterized protein LOC106939860, partial [Poecilia latipinna]|uniref:uncharacterized protein LOC106939860 n=1 Tax=Poecilia latipinna TaxID=48699 RepID=UPI00072E9808
MFCVCFCLSLFSLEHLPFPIASTRCRQSSEPLGRCGGNPAGTPAVRLRGWIEDLSSSWTTLLRLSVAYLGNPVVATSSLSASSDRRLWESCPAVVSHSPRVFLPDATGGTSRTPSLVCSPFPLTSVRLQRSPLRDARGSAGPSPNLAGEERNDWTGWYPVRSVSTTCPPSDEASQFSSDGQMKPHEAMNLLSPLLCKKQGDRSSL